ncbi:MAG: hypothetical protein HBSAPP03_23220 [Phycisphaerae bacterium]|nr:MAG: hypothetical protein HBSAPP03_23220 [Phycisphaerae bacterium]
MRNLITLKVDLDNAYVPMSGTSVVATFTLAAAHTNTQDAILEGTDGKEIPVAPGTQYYFERVDLSKVKVKSKAGESMLVVGHSAE